MTTAAEYREYATECTQWAVQAKTEEERRVFLAMAQQWVNAALMLEAIEGRPPQTERSGPPPSQTRH